MTVEIPANFPHDEFRLGGVAGAQPKLLVRKVGDRYFSGMTNDERQERYEICTDLAQQLISYCKLKQIEKPEWSIEDVLIKTSKGLRSKNWDFSEAEIVWMIERVAQELHSTQPKQ